MLKFTLAGALLCGVGTANAIVFDFETEDDFATPLINGQIVDSAFDAADPEFGNLVNISSTQNGAPGHLGVTVFDSDAADQIANTQDPDLLVNKGNILLLQNDENPASSVDATYGAVYDFPNDEDDGTDSGSIVFDFIRPITPESIDLIDVDRGAVFEVILTDTQNLTRTYTAGPRWTTDLTDGPAGWKTLDLTTLAAQPGESTGGPAIAVEDAGYNPASVLSIEVVIGGPRPSGGIDDLVVTPEPATAAVLGLGGLLLASRRRK